MIKTLKTHYIMSDLLRCHLWYGGFKTGATEQKNCSFIAAALSEDIVGQVGAGNLWKCSR